MQSNLLNPSINTLRTLNFPKSPTFTLYSNKPNCNLIFIRKKKTKNRQNRRKKRKNSNLQPMLEKMKSQSHLLMFRQKNLSQRYFQMKKKK